MPFIHHYPFICCAAAGLALFTPSLRAEPTVEMQKVLEVFAGLNPVPLEKTVPKVARLAPTMSAAAKAVMLKEGKDAPAYTGRTDDIKVAGKDGELKARIYLPKGEGPFPAVLYIHGGGWVIADIDVYDASAKALSEMSQAIVLSIEYRKAPEHPFPASHDDTLAAYKWLLKNVSQYKGDPKKVAVAGESAGGNMAASLCLSAKEEGIQQPVHQVLIYPVTDHATDTQSYKENTTTLPLNSKAMDWFFKYELSSPKDGDVPRFSVLRSNDLKGLPPATVIAAEIDPLRSEGKAYADKLQAAGVAVTYKLYKGVTHEFFGMGALLPEAKEAETLAADELKKAFQK